MCHIRGCDHPLGRKDILKFIYYFIIIVLIVYIFKYFLIISNILSPMECNNIIILNLIIFYLN
jgi:hypothetical protein